MTPRRPSAFTFLLALIALLLATLSPTVHAEDACPTLKYVVHPKGNGRRAWAGKVARISFSIKNKSPLTLDKYVVRISIPTDKVTYQSYNVYGTTARHKATTTFENDGSILAWTLYNMPAGDTFRIVVYVKVRDCAALGPVAFPISSYQDIGGFPTCPVLGPAGILRIVMPKKSKKEGRPPVPTGCDTPSPTPAPTLAPSASPSGPPTVCFNKEAHVLLGDGETWKAVGDLKKGDMVRTRGMAGIGGDDSKHTAALVAVVEMVDTEHTHHDGLCGLAPGFFLTSTHPLRLNGTGQWVRPKWVLPCSRRESFDALYNLILEEGHHSVHIQGFDVATLVPGPVGEVLLDMPHKFKWYEMLTSMPGFEEGWVTVNTAEMRALRPVGFDSSKYDALQYATVEASGVLTM